MDCRVKPGNDECKGAIQFNQNMLSGEEMAMRDPSLVDAKADIRQQAIKGGEGPIGDIMPCAGSRASRPQMHRCRGGQRRQNKEYQAWPIGHHRNNDEAYAVPTGRSFDGKGDANDEEQRRQHRLKQEKELASFTL